MILHGNALGNTFSKIKKLRAIRGRPAFILKKKGGGKEEKEKRKKEAGHCGKQSILDEHDIKN